MTAGIDWLTSNPLDCIGLFAIAIIYFFSSQEGSLLCTGDCAHAVATGSLNGMI
jgi:hypothetical protein